MNRSRGNKPPPLSSSSPPPSSRSSASPSASPPLPDTRADSHRRTHSGTISLSNRRPTYSAEPSPRSVASQTTSTTQETSTSRRARRDSEDTLVASGGSSSPTYAFSDNSGLRPWPTGAVSMTDYIRHKKQYSSSSAPSNSLEGGYGRRPLVDYVTNEWEKKQSYRDGSFSSDDGEEYRHYISEKALEHAGPPPMPLPAWVKRLQYIQVPRRVQRYLGGYALFLLALWFGWLYWLQPAWEHERLLDESVKFAGTRGNSFGVNVLPTFDGMEQLKTLDSMHVPTKGSDRRLVFVGDVHGCKDELQALLDKVHFNKKHDHLILTGDLIAKGPDSRGAIDLAMKLNASCVRGNWEDRTLLAHNTLHSKVHPLPGPAEDPLSKDDFLDSESFSHGDYKDRALAKLLSKKQVEWLKACPVILKVGAVEGFNGGSEIVVAHGGLIPGLAYEKQDPFQVMNMRSIDLRTRMPSEDRRGEPWEKLWNHYMVHLGKKSKEDKVTVVYGHDAKRGLNIKTWSKGLDSGCVRGGRLTALVVDSRGRERTYSVACEQYKS